MGSISIRASESGKSFTTGRTEAAGEPKPEPQPAPRRGGASVLWPPTFGSLARPFLVGGRSTTPVPNGYCPIHATGVTLEGPIVAMEQV